MRGYNPYAARFSALALFIVPLLNKGALPNGCLSSKSDIEYIVRQPEYQCFLLEPILKNCFYNEHVCGTKCRTIDL